MATQLAISGMEEIAKRDDVNPLVILQQAVSQGASVETLERLMGLAERYQQNIARQEYVEALAAFKRNPPEIIKNKHVKFGNTEYDHATLDHVCEQIATSLSTHGLSHTWEVQQSNGVIKVGCKLTHKAGHSETVWLEAGADTSGAKNSIQAIGSTVTYLERYTLLAATGLAARLQDDDGSGAGNGAKYEDLNERLEWIQNASAKELFRIWKQAYDAAEQVGDKSAMAALTAAKDKRRKEVGNA